MTSETYTGEQISFGECLMFNHDLKMCLKLGKCIIEVNLTLFYECTKLKIN